MGITVAISGNTVEVKDLREAFAFAKDNKKTIPLEKLTVIGMATVLKNFHVGGRPKKWKPLKNRVGQPLQKTGVLKNTVQYKILGDDNFKIHTGEPAHPHAAIHQFGTKPYTILPVNAKALRWEAMGMVHYAKRVEHPGIPARPYMVWQKEDAAKMAKVIADHVIEQIGKSGRGKWDVHKSQSHQ